ncbi:MAG TPA: hypothetical protein VF719_06470, partial [Abditibacteriaceae bacterium]
PKTRYAVAAATLLLATGLVLSQTMHAAEPVPVATTLSGPGTGSNSTVAPMSRSGMVYSLAFTPDSRWLYSGDDRGVITVWDANTATRVRVLGKNGNFVQALSFSADGRYLLSGGSSMRPGTNALTGGEATLWDVRIGKVLYSWKSSDFYIRSAVLSPDGKRAAFGGLNGKNNTSVVRIWDTKNPAKPKQVASLLISPDARREINPLAWSPNGNWLAVSYGPQTSLWNAATGKKVRDFASGAGNIGFPEPVVFAPDNKTLAKGAWGGTLEIQDTVSGEVKQRFVTKMFGFAMQAVRFSIDGARLFSTNGMDLYQWNVATGELLKKSERIGAENLALASDETKFAGMAGNDLMLWRQPQTTKKESE